MTCDANRVFPRRKTLSLDEVEEDFTMVHKEIEKDWIQTLGDCFERKFRMFEDTKFTQCVCLGLGSLSNHHPYDPWPKNPLHLPIFLMILVGLLRKKHNIQDIYFQDPRFTAVDISFLRSQEYHVLDDARAFDIIDSSTLILPTFSNSSSPLLSLGGGTTLIFPNPLNSSFDNLATKIRHLKSSI